MDPEKEDGNIEYKLKLLNKSEERIEELASQMRYRCDEGESECIYNLGVEDDGTEVGLTIQEYEETLKTLNSAADKNNYSVKLLTTKNINNEKSTYEILIREYNENKYIDIKVAVAGSVNAGKSSMLACLISGKNDDGRGSARLSVFNFKHEVDTGRTSSIAHHIMGFDKDHKIVNYSGNPSWPDIVRDSVKIISFTDLAGHDKYLKTTIQGLASSKPDLCLILVGANRGVLKMTKEHIFISITLGIPFAMVITKIDMVGECQNVLQETIDSIYKILKCPGVRRIPIKIKTSGDVIRSAINIHSGSIVPVFSLSNVSGEGHDKLKEFLNLVNKKKNIIIDSDVEYHIDSKWVVTGVGSVVGGYLVNGKISVGDKLYIGPNNDKYEQVVVKSIHCKRVPVQDIDSSSYVCLGLRKIQKKDIRRGTVIVSSNKIACRRFVADVKVLKSHSTTIKIGYTPIVHCSSIRQAARLVHISDKKNSRRPEKDTDNNILRTGDSATTIFEFAIQAEFIKVNDIIILCEGNTKLVGTIKYIL